MAERHGAASSRRPGAVAARCGPHAVLSVPRRGETQTEAQIVALKRFNLNSISSTAARLLLPLFLFNRPSLCPLSSLFSQI